MRPTKWYGMWRTHYETLCSYSTTASPFTQLQTLHDSVLSMSKERGTPPLSKALKVPRPRSGTSFWYPQTACMSLSRAPETDWCQTIYAYLLYRATPPTQSSRSEDSPRWPYAKQIHVVIFSDKDTACVGDPCESHDGGLDAITTGVSLHWDNAAHPIVSGTCW